MRKRQNSPSERLPIGNAISSSKQSSRKRQKTNHNHQTSRTERDPTEDIAPSCNRSSRELETNDHFHDEGIISPHARRISSLEDLPTELLGPIFFSSMNGNLLKASPRIAHKLSGSQSVNRCAFLLAFFGSHIKDLTEFFKLEDFFLETLDTFGSWEKRSMMKAVLDSKWCTIGWMRRAHIDMAQFAMWMFGVKFQGCCWDPARLLAEVQESFVDKQWPANGSNYGGFAHGTRRGIRLEYAGSFSCYIYYESPHQESGDRRGPVLWAMKLEAWGRPDLHQVIKWNKYEEQTLFKECFSEANGLSNVSRVDGGPKGWCCPSDDLEQAVRNNDTRMARACLELEYYLTPEDHPLLISPYLYRYAACHSNPRLMVQLFCIDSLSLPKDDPILVRWAREASHYLDGLWSDNEADCSYLRHLHKRWKCLNENSHDPSADFQKQHGECPIGPHAYQENILRSERIADELDELLQYIDTGRDPGHGYRMSPSFDLLSGYQQPCREENIICSCGFDLTWEATDDENEFESDISDTSYMTHLIDDELDMLDFGPMGSVGSDPQDDATGSSEWGGSEADSDNEDSTYVEHFKDMFSLDWLGMGHEIHGEVPLRAFMPNTPEWYLDTDEYGV